MRPLRAFFLLLLPLTSCATLGGPYYDDGGIEASLAEEPLLAPDGPLVVRQERAPLELPLRLAIAPPIADETRGLRRARRFVDSWSEGERAAIDRWADELREAGVLDEVVHLPSILVDADPEQRSGSLVARMRRAAAGMGCDALLVVRTASRASSRTRALGILDITIVGGLVLNGHEVRSRSVAEGLVVAVASGAPCLVGRGEAEKTDGTPAIFELERAEALLDRSRGRAVARLVESLAEDARDALAREAAAPAPAAGGA